jgi:hypothetical protein
MKTFLEKFLKKFSQFRDWLLVALVIGGIFFFMQKSQAVKEMNPTEIWQQKYGNVVKPVPQVVPGDPNTKPVGPLGPASSADIFKQIQVKDIEAISVNPVFTPAVEYNRLKVRLEGLKKDYQDAIAGGEPKNAIEKLSQYCKDDPKGRILEWPNPPQIILSNLICEEGSQSLISAIESAKTANQSSSAAGDSTNLYQTIESLAQAYSSLKRAVDDVEANPECAETSQGRESHLSEAKTLLETLRQGRENLNQKLVRQDYDAVMRDGAAVDAKSTAESVAELIQKIRSFRDLLKRFDPDGTILNQAQLDRLQEIQTRVENGKEARVAQVRQKIGALTAVTGYEEDRQALEGILKMFDTLKMLEDPKADSDRREYEGMLMKLDAAATVDETNKLLEGIESEIEKIKHLVESNGDYRPSVKTVTDALGKVDDLYKKPGVKKASKDLGPRIQRVKKNWTALKPKLQK